GGSLAALGAWMLAIVRDQALPGLVATLVLSQIAMVCTGLVALTTFPLVSRHFTGRIQRIAGHIFMVALRSTPEFVLTYILLLLWGPSMLPAVVALALHNGGIIGTLVGRHADTIALPAHAARGVDRYTYEIVPRVYGQFLAFVLYRWEVIMRET